MVFPGVLAGDLEGVLAGLRPGDLAGDYLPSLVLVLVDFLLLANLLFLLVLLLDLLEAGDFDLTDLLGELLFEDRFPTEILAGPFFLEGVGSTLEELGF